MRSILIKGVILFSCIGSFLLSKGQNIPGDTVNNKNAILFSPLNLFDPINPSFQLGYERMLNEKWALQFEGAYIIVKSIGHLIDDNSRGIPNSDYSNEGFKGRVEIKYVFEDKGNIKLYVSSELFYLKNKSEVVDQFLVSDTTYNYSFDLPYGHESDSRAIEYDDYFTNDKEKYGVNLKFGFKFTPGDHYLLETYIGAGIASRENKHSERENINDQSSWEGPLNDTQLGKRWILNVPFNIKLGYRF